MVRVILILLTQPSKYLGSQLEENWGIHFVNTFDLIE